jgi:hypothetical protein
MKNVMILTLVALPVLSACDEVLQVEPVTPPDVEPVVETLDPTPPPPPPPTARTVEQFDTTSQEDREAAVATPQPAQETRLGATNVSLGDVTDPGIWLKTGLVDQLTLGRVAFPDKGTSVNLELRPSGGAATAASQMSLAAMRLLEIPLTALADVIVFKRPPGSGGGSS